MRIPLLSGDLDVAALRGPPINAEAGLKFTSFRHSQFGI